MPSPGQGTKLTSLRLQGFRAFLQPQTFDLKDKERLAIFAPNGSGKSSVVDAFEFMFSKVGTLERLGQRAINNNAGPSALAHNLADEAGISPQVTMAFQIGGVGIETHRSAIGQRQRSDEVEAVCSEFIVNPIIRGHSLRRFVEEQTAEDRYGEVAKWLELTPLVEAQKNLRLLRSQTKILSEDASKIEDLETKIREATENRIARWDDSYITDYINELITELDPDITIDTVWNETIDQVLAERAATEDEAQGLLSLKQTRDQLYSLYDEEQTDESSERRPIGAIANYENALLELEIATMQEAEERSKAANSIFSQVWKEAERLFKAFPNEFDDCPVCETPLSDTRAGGREQIVVRLEQKQATLAEYSAARQSLVNASETAKLALPLLKQRLEQLPAWLVERFPDLKTAVAQYLDELKQERVDPRSSRNLITALQQGQSKFEASISEIEDQQDKLTYKKVVRKIAELRSLGRELALALQTRAELQNLQRALNSQSTIVSSEIRQEVQKLLDNLRVPTNEIYAAIQAGSAVPVRLDLPAETDTNQQRLQLLIDFAANREGVQPSGFLSDSQIHTLALALRLAAIEKFNTGCRLIVLDDIITSYDADHRRLVSGLLVSRYSEYQVILTTHDERFFIYLKDQALASEWQFLRITKLDPNFGPRIAQHKVSDAAVERRWEDGVSAANEMRQAEEEWLLEKCHEFGVKVQIRPVERAHSYERAELAEALALYLKGCNLDPPNITGVQNRFLESLKSGVVENFGSHFQLEQYGAGSSGDEKARWKEFKEFRELFRCSACGRRKFKRPISLSKPVCAHSNCETPLAFPVTS